MISFVWTEKDPMFSGRGGSENCTVGHIRELTEMGIDARVVTVGRGKKFHSNFFPDIQFEDVASLAEVAELDDTVVFINLPHPIDTKNPSFCFFHCPPQKDISLRAEYKAAMVGKTPIVASKFMQSTWTKYLGLPDNGIPIVFPFADPAFANVVRPLPTSDKTSVLFAGRLMPEKGVYLYLEAIHHTALKQGFTFSITNAGNQTEDGAIIEAFLKHHPQVNLLEARHTPTEVAGLLAQYQILVMPSTKFYWHEGFGMLSVEAQHAGCQVIGSDHAGLPETDCGGLTLFESGNSFALAETIREVAQGKPVTAEQRKERCKFFTRRQSVERLLEVLDYE